MSLFGDLGTLSQGFGTHQRSSTGSLDELDTSSGSVGSTTPVASTERFERQMRQLQQSGHHLEDEEEWDIISKKIDSCVRLDTQFFEYPTQDVFSSPPTSGNVDDDELTGTKVFLGGMRFEVVQMGRHMVSWLLEVSSGVKLPFGRILIHRKSRNGKPAAPTGCASVYVADEDDVKRLIRMNQRIFCGERGLHVAATPERMAELIQSRNILDIVDGRVRGPTHPMIIEKAYSSSVTHSPVSLATTPQNNGSFSSSSLTGSFSGKTASPPVLLADGSSPPVYHKYEGDAKTQLLSDNPPVLQQPLELFIGGLCYEATRTFVSWIFGLIGIRLHPQNVTLYVDPLTGVKRGCAQVKIEECDFLKASAYTRRMLCDACGVYIAETPQGIVAVQQTKERTDHGTRGPTHAVVIERRRNTATVQRGGGPSVNHHHHHQSHHNQQQHHQNHNHTAMGPPPPPPPLPMSGGGGHGNAPPPPPPPPMQVVQMPGGQYVMLVNAQGGAGGYQQLMQQHHPQQQHQQQHPPPQWQGQVPPPFATIALAPMATPPGGGVGGGPQQMYAAMPSYRVQGTGPNR